VNLRWPGEGSPVNTLLREAWDRGEPIFRNCFFCHRSVKRIVPIPSFCTVQHFPINEETALKRLLCHRSVGTVKQAGFSRVDELSLMSVFWGEGRGEHAAPRSLGSRGHARESHSRLPVAFVRWVIESVLDGLYGPHFSGYNRHPCA
jgi:hypothetical protein